ncbi:MULTISPECIES: SDR family oxidoreductase [unclassified Sphingopyxis]|uniref:SDR family oxidoreductase n=1 Tax=unclassified Sphingopyxis TaxID=2614943 RepID=UPI00286593F9|nr:MULTISPECIES: SDR family oxidoreductase [unclassified Sphingopyxis]MDR6834087.1 NAD(P)-dependent dehydrogenase (short-subunit alcohol dehydrogenase family) [Sphingopyxis sp. BE122]MDR7226355.1 NAD(P)-dependent dehydrogenase (short-subunit alcohol dehydrogenase family) [Sphingopyxis sp. BE259]
MLESRHIVIIGGSSGIGFAVAEAAIAAGATVRIGSTSMAKIEAAVARLGPRATGAIVDTTDEVSLAAFFAGAGAIHHLAHTAGDRLPRGLTIGPDFDLLAAQGAMGARFWGPLLAVKHALPYLAPDASVTLTAGLYAHRPAKGSTMSTAIAGAVEHLARGLAVELAPIRVNAVTPGLIATEMWAKVPDAARSDMTRPQPLPRMGTPHDAAEAYLYFMRAGFTTGQIAVVDGGRIFA